MVSKQNQTFQRRVISYIYCLQVILAPKNYSGVSLSGNNLTKSLTVRSIWHLEKELSAIQITKIPKISKFVPSFQNFKIHRENLIKIKRGGGRTSNLEAPHRIRRIGLSEVFSKIMNDNCKRYRHFKFDTTKKIIFIIVYLALLKKNCPSLPTRATN